MSAPKLMTRDIIERFHTLKTKAKRHADNPTFLSSDLELHDAAMAYARAVNRVAKKDRR